MLITRLSFAIVLFFGFVLPIKGTPPTAEQRAKALAALSASNKTPTKSTCVCTGPENCTCAPGTCTCPNCATPTKVVDTAPQFITVKCSPTATVLIDGKCTHLTGSVRVFEAPRAGSYTILCCDNGVCEQRVVSTNSVVEFSTYTAQYPAQYQPMPMPMAFGGFGGGFGGGCAGGG